MAALNSKASGEHKQEGRSIEGANESGFFSEQGAKGGCSVKVAVRVRPMLPRETAAGDTICTNCDDARNSIVVGCDKQYGFDRIFGINSKQEDVFDVCVKNLVLGSFAGYNSTVLAYGQTGSGKTYTMGTDATLAVSKDNQGIVPRVIRLMFDEVEKRKVGKEFLIKVSFIEIYNEEIHDLLDPQGGNKIVIRELTRGIPSLCGQREEQVTDYEALFKMLEKGALNRRTKSTLMNESSSRSHAIFTINIEQHVIEDLYPKETAVSTDPSSASTPPAAASADAQEFMTAKFHFVDLAGSERIKKTGAEGDTMHEGISINKALFVLGKVINALTDESGRTAYRPYRESNLTRILQDSLGGNARTTMIACVSPAESSQEETLSTLLYACKARSIKNKPVVNHDPTTTLIHQLQQQVYDLQHELTRYKKGGSVPLPLKMAETIPGGELGPDKDLKAEIAALKRQNEDLKASLSHAEDQYRKKEIEYLNVEKQRDLLQIQNEKFKAHISKIAPKDLEMLISDSNEGLSALEEYRRQIAELQTSNGKKEHDYKELQTKYEDECRNANAQSEQMFKLNQEIQQLKRTVVKMRKSEPRRSSVIQRHQVFAVKAEESAAILPAPETPGTDTNNTTSGSGEQWLSAEMDEQIKEVNEMFINELAHSLGSLIPEPAKPSSSPDKSEAKPLSPEAATTVTDMSSSNGAAELEKPKECTEEEAEAMMEGEFGVEDENAEEQKDEKETEAGKEMKETLNKVEVDIHEREKALEQIKEKQKEMQNSLIAIMKEQCHKKVGELEKELEKLRSDQEKAMQIAPKDTRSNVELQYKKKIGEYEGKLREYKRSEAHEQQLLKQTAEQEARIQSLSEVISKMKQQKVELARQMKKDRETYERTKREQAKETLKLKQESIKQKMLISKLTREKERAIRLKAVARKESLPLPKKEQAATYKHYVAEFTARLVNLREETVQIQREEGKQRGIEARLEEENKTLCKLKVEGEKLLAMKAELNPTTDYDRIQGADVEIEKNKKIEADLQAVIDNLECTLRYHEEKVARIEQGRTQLKSQLACLFGKGKVKSARDMNSMITVLFDSLADEKIKQNCRDMKTKADESVIESLQANIQQLMSDQTNLREEYRAEIARLEKLHMDKELALVSELESVKGASAEPNIESMTELDVRRSSPTGGSAAADTAKTRQESSSTKEKGENVEFIRKELEKCKKRNADLIKENSKLCGQISELTIRNETLKKTVANQSRKAIELSSKHETPTSSGGTPKFVSLNAKRQDWKRRANQNHLSGRVDSQEGRKLGNKSMLVGSVAEGGEPAKDITAEIEAIERGRQELANSSDNVHVPSPETVPEVSSAKAPSNKGVEEEKKSTELALGYSSLRTNAASGLLKGTAAKLATCKPNPKQPGKYALADEIRGVRRASTAAGIVPKGRSKSPVEGRVAIDGGKGKLSPEMSRQSSTAFASSTSGTPISTFAAGSQPTFQEAAEPSRWKCVSSQEYHGLGIFSLAAFDQYLISSSNVLKMWDINKKLIAAELPNTISKCLYVDQQRKLLIGNTEQTGTVTFWSLPDLAPVGTVETGMKSVRALYVDKHILFIGGCCSTGALQLWDINTMTKLCERERNPDSDIFSIFKKGPVVFYGGRNRCINRLDLDSLEVLPTLSPAHYGAVNALTNLGDTLISGCREYLLRAWDYETGKEKYPEVKCTSTLNAVQTDKDEQLLYAAGKDGHIKVWKIKDNRLLETEGSMSHGKSVNALTRISASHTTAFASAGDDRTVKIWRQDS